MANIKRFVLLLFLLISFISLAVFCAGQKQFEVSQYDVVWDSPSADSKGSMPLGNGEIGINVWAEKTGDVFLYIGRTDVWNSNCSLAKVGKVKLHFTPNPFAEGEPFEQRLDLANGEIHIHAGSEDNRFNLQIWVDANSPVIHFQTDSKQPLSVETSLHIWRTEERQLSGNELHTAYGVIKAPFPVLVYPDTVLAGRENEIVWAHQNKASIWRETLERQGMDSWIESATDPLLHNVFGGVIKGEGLVSDSPTALKSGQPGRSFHLKVFTHTAQNQSVENWENELRAVIEKAEQVNPQKSQAAHRTYWNNFWERSWIYADGTPDARTVTQSFVLQRFISACAGRGAFPQKFNGSLFNVDSMLADFPFDADYRRWGGPYWLQNTRLIYWPMLANGDYDMMAPFFRMYKNALPYAQAATKHFFNHEGAFFPETMYFWGSYVMDNFGWNTSHTPFKYTENQYIRYYYQGALEVAAIMLEYYNHTRDEKFARDFLLPYAHQVVLFYAEHYPRDENGKIRIYPSQALETYWDAENPTPPIAGLRWNVKGILKLPEELFSPKQREFFEKIVHELPEIPVGTKDGKDVVLPAGKINGEPRNHENPEFYAIFPYRFYGVGKPDLERMRNSFMSARVKSASGWAHYDVNAAFLGITDSAKTRLVERTAAKNPACRFPAFWGPNYDWIPDQDHGSNILIALQAMLIQTHGDKIFIFPAWPKEWNVKFKLHAPKETIVQCELRNGEVHNLKVTPGRRKKDITILGFNNH